VTLEFQILGPLEARRGDTRLPLKGHKQRLLLATLLLRANEVVSSDRLIEALWGEAPPATAGKALQMHVSQLRDLLEPERARGSPGGRLMTRPPGYELRLENGALDLHRFEEAVGEARAELRAGRPEPAAAGLAGALALWRGPPLGDLGFEASLQADIARLEELRLATIEDRVDADLALGRHAELIGELERLAAANPHRERIRAQLMLALYRTGRQAEALEAYQQARRALVDELGLEPGRALQELERAILTHDQALDPAGPAARPSRQAAAPELVGRGRELSELVAILDTTFGGTGAVALVGGEPGIGKSRLADALAWHARERGGRVLVGRCWEAGGAPPYWPWVQALRSYARDAGPDALRAHAGAAAPELATMLPEVAGGAQPSAAPESEAARFKVFEAVAALIRSVAAEEPLVFLLDDLHSADAPSLLLLRFVAREVTGARVLVVGCYRDTEVGPGLAEALAELTRDAVVARVILKGLAPDATHRLLELTMGRAPAGELASRVHAGTAGNPLFAGEVGRLLASADPAEAARGELPIPDSVREAIGQRVQRQSEQGRHVLTLASVLGREFDVDALERVSALSQEELFATLEEAIEARLIGPVPGTPGRLRFAHVLVRDALYEDVPATRRLHLHGRIGEALETLYEASPEPHLSELAHHFFQAGSAGVEKAIGYARRAGDQSASQLAYEEAARHYVLALELLERTGAADGEDACELLISLGEARSRAGDESGAKEAFRRAAELAERTGRSDQLARAAIGYGGRFVWARAGSDAALVPLLERALAAISEDDSPERVRLLARLAPAIRDEPLRERRLRLAHEALEMARRIGDPRTLAYALDGYWPATEGPDNPDERATGPLELTALGAEIGDNERTYVGHDYRLHGLWTLCDRAGVDIELDALAELAGELRQPAQLWHLRSLDAMLALMEGRLERAEELLGEALGIGLDAQGWNAHVSHRLGLFVLRREQGRLAEIEELMRRSAGEYPALPRFRSALAHLYAELGREQDARAPFDEVMARDLAHEHLDAEWLFTVNLLSDTCAFLADEQAAARLYDLLAPFESYYAEAPMEASFGSVARGLGVLATAIHRFDEAERHLGSAIEIERRMGARGWLAHARHDLGAMLLKRAGPGDADRAAGLLGEAVAAYRELGMEPWAERAAVLR
jgi:DNA-binding SARP family transcriptional activator